MVLSSLVSVWMILIEFVTLVAIFIVTAIGYFLAYMILYAAYAYVIAIVSKVPFKEAFKFRW